jgi:hypothetical protein
MRRWLPGALVVSGSVSVLFGILLITQTEAGFWPVALGLVSVFLGLLARARPSVLESEGYRAVVALGFLVLALALFYSAIEAMRRGEPGAAIFRIVGTLAGLYIPLGWMLGLIAEERIRSGKGGSATRWAAKMWGRGGDSRNGAQT